MTKLEVVVLYNLNYKKIKIKHQFNNNFRIAHHRKYLYMKQINYQYKKKK